MAEPTFMVPIAEISARRSRAPFPHPRSVWAVEALARWRGPTTGVEVAEALMLGRKIISQAG